MRQTNRPPAINPKVIAAVDRAIAAKSWRSIAETEAFVAAGWPKAATKREIEAYVRKRYDDAGAGFSGRWQP